MANKKSVGSKIDSKKTKEKALVKRKRSASKKVSIEILIINSIENACKLDKDVFLLCCEESHAILVKKCIVNIHYVKNPTSMQPRETLEERTFFHMFVMQWKGDKISGELIDMGMPVIWISYPEDVGKCINKIGS